jgi:membrane fusion protein (multidrug efflux system)
MLAATLLFAGCGDKAKSSPPPGASRPPPTVGTVTLQTETVPLVNQFAGRTEAFETSQVRPQVSGVIEERLFKEGAVVEKGQTLYQIDSRLYRAAVDQAQANLASAKANLAAAKSLAERYAPLVKIQAVSQQEYDDAQAKANQAAAAVQQAEAALQTAQINLRYTKVPAPISGRTGRSLVTTGALVTQGQAQPLTTIQNLDPIFVDVQQSSAQLLSLRKSLGDKSGLSKASAEVRLTLPDGSEYAHPGTLEFSEPTVDPATGSVTLRARFPNPEGLLLPGMYVTAKLAQAIQQDAILAPQAGIQRDPKGNASALVVGPDNKVEQRQVTADRTVGNRWLVTDGLKSGDVLIVEGTGKVRPGMVVSTVAANTPIQFGTAKGGTGGAGTSQTGSPQK